MMIEIAINPFAMLQITISDRKSKASILPTLHDGLSLYFCEKQMIPTLAFFTAWAIEPSVEPAKRLNFQWK